MAPRIQKRDAAPVKVIAIERHRALYAGIWLFDVHDSSSFRHNVEMRS